MSSSSRPAFLVQPDTLFIAALAGKVPPKPGSSVDIATITVQKAFHDAVAIVSDRRVAEAILRFGLSRVVQRVVDEDLCGQVRLGIIKDDRQKQQAAFTEQVVRYVRLSLGVAATPQNDEPLLPPSVHFKYRQHIGDGTRDSVERACRAVEGYLELKADLIARELLKGLTPPFFRRVMFAARQLREALSVR